MARGIGAGPVPRASIWGSLSEAQIADAEKAAVERAQLAGREVESFFDLTPGERRAARELALHNER